MVYRQLGFSKALQDYSGAKYGQGTGPIWLDDTACLGWEPLLYDCRHSEWLRPDCTHSEDASVQCSHGYDAIRLVSGGATYGRVEICKNGQWGSVCVMMPGICMTRAWPVVSLHFGFSGASFTPCYAAYGQGSGPILRNDIYCQGSDASLLNFPKHQVTPGYCAWSPRGCSCGLLLVEGEARANFEYL